jgi:hypothetical protein
MGLPLPPLLLLVLDMPWGLDPLAVPEELLDLSRAFSLRFRSSIVGLPLWASSPAAEFVLTMAARGGIKGIVSELLLPAPVAAAAAAAVTPPIVWVLWRLVCVACPVRQAGPLLLLRLPPRRLSA